MLTASEILTAGARDALYAPSALNTQPWTWCVRGDVLELYSDRDRQLLVADPDGRLLLLSCGIALHHARVSLAATGDAAIVRRLVDSFDDNVLAQVELGQPRSVSTEDRALREAIFRRRTDRRPYGDSPVPEHVLAALASAAESEGASLHIVRLGQMPMLAIATAQAAAAEMSEPDYRAELMRWTNRPQWSGDGVPPEATVARAPRRVPVRELALEPNSGQPVDTIGDRGATYLVLYGQSDSASDWFAAGLAASNVLLTATTLGLATEPMSDMIEVAHPRDLIAGLLPNGGRPYLVIRCGWSEHATPIPPTARRDSREAIVTYPDRRSNMASRPRCGSVRSGCSAAVRWTTRLTGPTFPWWGRWPRRSRRPMLAATRPSAAG
jgi:nitroreductase